jgi:hypothetical protein
MLGLMADITSSGFAVSPFEEAEYQHFLLVARAI